MDYAKESLKMHYELRGKLEMTSRAAVDTKDALSLAYTPGVAAPCLEIQKDVNKSYELTRRWNTVAVVTDGTAVRSCPEGFFCFTVKFNKVFYKEKNLSASHPFQTGKQTDFFLYSATIFCSQTPFLTRTNPITHLIRSTDITIK